MSIKTTLTCAAALVCCAAAASPAWAATITEEDGVLVVRTGGGDDALYLDDSYNPPDPAQLLRIEGAVFTAVPESCAQRDDDLVDCPVPARLRVELGAGDDRFGVLNRLSFATGEVVVDGGPGADGLTGDHTADRDETLLGGPGDDRIDAMGGSDVLDGGSGNDRLDGRAGADVVLGGDGDDELAGDGQAAPGADRIDGGAGSDILKDYTQADVDVHPPADISLDGLANDGRPDEGDDVRGIERAIAYVAGTHVLSDAAEDWQVWANLSGGGERSVVRALGGNDRVVGEDGIEDIDGGTGDDYLEGGKNHDTITGGPGRDVIFGDETDTTCNADFPESCVRYGNDVIQARDGEVDQIDCGPGTDRVVADAGDVVAANCETVERGSGPSTSTPVTPGEGAQGPSKPGGPTRTARLALAKQVRLGTALRSGFTLRLSGATPGRTTVVVRHGGRTLAKVKVTVPRSGVATVRVRLTKADVRRLRTARRATFAITGAGVRTTLTLRR